MTRGSDHVGAGLLGIPRDLRGRCSREIKDLFDTEPAVYFSVVSRWEISIKQSPGKLEGPEDLAARARDSQFTGLSITARHGVGQVDFRRIIGISSTTEYWSLKRRSKGWS